MERIFEAGFLLLLALPLLRIGVEPGLRRRFQAFPPMQALMIGSLVAYGVAIISMAMMTPALLRPATFIALVMILVLSWQSRESFGSDRGLPPGPLSFLPAAPWRDPQYYKKASVRYGPVFKFRHIVDPAVGIVGAPRVADFMRKHERDLSVPPAPFNTLIPGGFVRYMSGTQHKITAGLFRSAFTQAVVESCDGDFAAQTKSTLASIAESGRSGLDPVPAIDHLVLNEMMVCFLGIRPGAQLDRFARLYEVGDYRCLARVGKKRAKAAILELVDETRALNLARAGKVDAQRSFLTELADSHPEAIDSDEAMGNFVYALHLARLDVSGLLVWLLAMLAENSGWVTKLRDALAASEHDALRIGGLADRIVRETLRLRQSEFLMRRAERPIEWDGFTIPTGWHVRLCIAESHRSVDAFDRPDVFDPDRFMQALDRTRYSPFGFAPHLCPGEHLTRAMGRRLAAEIARGYEISVRGVDPWEFNGFHWRPNDRMRVALTQLA